MKLRPVILYVAYVAVVVGLLVLAFHWQWVVVHASQETGTSNSSSRAYDFWSGFGSDIGQVALIGGLVTLVRHHNCHNVGCWRIGKIKTASGHTLCRHCAKRPETELNLPPIHQDHQ